MPVSIKNEDILTGLEKFTLNVRKSKYHQFYGCVRNTPEILNKIHF